MHSSVYEQAIKKVDSQYRTDFAQFVESGEAKQEFLDYIDRDKDAQDAVEMVFIEQSQELHNLAIKMRENKKEGILEKIVKRILGK